MFLHNGLLHLIGNMFFLWAFVQTLEYSLGSVRFLVLYVLWGIAAGLIHTAVNWGSDMPMIGASGAIAGMVGAYWVTFGSFTKIRTGLFIGLKCVRFDVPAGVYIVIWILMQLLGAAMADGQKGGVASYAHLGGFAAGGLTMVFFKESILSRLVVDGNYVGLRDAPAKAARPGDEASEPHTSPNICPYCKQPLDAASHLAANLLRCDNPVCRRCIYLEGNALT